MNHPITTARSIFIEAIENYAPDQWGNFLNEACRDDVALRQRVELLLNAHQGDDSFLDRGADDQPSAAIDGEITEGPGTVIGPYKLVQQIGEGGFGVVFLAEQERPVKRRVALKVIKPGMDTRQVIARFDAERQALAMMDHPCIAKVYDAGTTGEESGRQNAVGSRQLDEDRQLDSAQPDSAPPPTTHRLPPTSSSSLTTDHRPLTTASRPYFVMELVHGVPITEYCDQCNLTTTERLELFDSVCQAVQHAHQKGVIHRDIKPTNVLVAMQDGRPAPKIIDFGVAKAINQQLTEHSLMTAFAQIVGTPLYMSPEQAELSPLGIDTRSDIYSLGVLLYELLTSTTPFDKDRLHAAAYDEFRRIIREEEPPRPSARLSTLGADLAVTIAERRRTDVRRLEHTVRGELDWVVMKCLEKERNRRYESAGSLARDIERYLYDEPVQACPPSAGYRFRKFARRNKTLLAAAGAISATLVIGLGLSTWMYFRECAAVQIAKANEMRATIENARAKAVAGLLQEMLSLADATRAKGADYKVRDLLDDSSRGLGNQLAGQPDVEADIQAIIGRAYLSLMLPSQAQPHFEKAIELRRKIDGPQHENVANILVDYAWDLHDQQKYSKAESLLKEALEIYRRRGVTGGPIIHALRVLQHVLISCDRDVEAERVTEEALAIASQSSEEIPDQANLLHRYAAMKIRQGRFTEGENLARQSVDMHRRVHGNQHPETAWALRALAAALRPQQKLAEAEAALRESLAIFRHCYAGEGDTARWVVDDLKTVLKARGDQSALETLTSEEQKQEFRLDTPDYHVRLAELLMTTNPDGEARTKEARRQIQRAIEGCGRLAVNGSNSLNQRLAAVGPYLEVARVCTVLPGFVSELNEVKRILNAEYSDLLVTFPDPEDTVDTLYCFALARLRLGDQAGYLQACEAISHMPVDVLDEGRKFRRTWIWCLAPHAIEELRIPLSDAEDALAKHSFDTRHSQLLVLGGMLYRNGQYEQAARHLEEFITAYPADPLPGEATINYQRLFRAMARWQQGEKVEACRLLAETQPAIDEELQSPSVEWNRRATLEVLRREAETLIGKVPINQAKQEKTPSDSPSNP
jgi:eukaryotic-like serine/threonine-protein kinase